MAKAVKEKYNKPCITVGNIRDPQVAEDILAGGDADFIGMGRGLIADPEWVNKVEFGNVCDIRKCISCNIGCAGHRIGLNQPIRCTVNPAVNSGEDYMKTKVNKPCNVVVIGGGTAGLEAACTAAEVGCTTFLIEKKAELGGLASVISRIPDKKRLADFPNYMIHRAGKLHNLFVFKNTTATVDMVKALNPDIIVNATGSVPTLPPITGLHDLVDKDGSNVATVLKMIERINEYPEDMKGQKIAIIGGGPAGLSAAMTARNRNLSVCVICGGAADSALYKAGHVTNYPGVPDVSGPALLETMTQQARALGADILRERALSAMPMGKTFGVSAGKEFAEGRALLLATGIAQRGTFPGEAEFLGRGVSYCATCDGMLYRGKRAAVIGLAADAPEEADFLREIGCDVHYYDGKKHRFEIRGAERADALVVDGTAEPADVVFILRAGFAADTLLPGLATDNGHIVVDDDCAASIPGVFAAGDCTGAPYQIPAAVGEGNRAALSVVRWLRNA